VRKFIEKRAAKQSNESQQLNTNDNDAAIAAEPLTTDRPNKKCFIVLPYVSRKAEHFGKRLKRLVATHYPDVDFKVVFKTHNDIAKKFPFKDNIKSTMSRSLVVYHIKCATCGASYIGETKRLLQIRIEEHQDPKKKSSCYKHCNENNGHQMDYDNVEILDSADSEYKLKMKELLHIVHHKPAINIQYNDRSKFNIKTLIIAAYPSQSSEVVTD